MKNRLAEARDVMDMLSTIEDDQQRKAVVVSVRQHRRRVVA
jgi:hypothetical protein